MKDIGIYIHVPFCEKKCEYCDFYSNPTGIFGCKDGIKCRDDAMIDAYVDELLSEIKSNAGRNYDKCVRTVYIGGGTPSLLKIEHLSKIFDAIYRYFCCKIEETTIEVNPNSSDLLAEYKQLGIDRVSIGVQSTDDRVLQLLGRLHTADEALKCLDTASTLFDNVSADLIIGVVPEQDIKRDLELILPRVNHLSTYMLKVEEGTPLHKKQEEGLYVQPDDDIMADQYDMVYKTCLKNNFYRYEVSNFALIGKESKHNSSYWKMVEYLGFGPSAHSYLNGVRYFNPSDISSYIAGNHSGNGNEQLERGYSEAFEKKEFIMLGLRTTGGFNVKEYNSRFHADYIKEHDDVLKKMSAFIVVTPERIRIRPQFMLAQNSIIYEIIYELL